MGHPGWSTAAFGLILALAPIPAGAQTGETPRADTAAGSTNLDIKVGTLELHDLTFKTPGEGTLSVGRIGFTGFTGFDRSGDRSRAERIDIDDVTVTAGSQTVEIPSIVIAGADFPTSPLDALAAGEAPGDLAELLTSATVERLTIDRIVQRDASVKLEATHNGFVFSALKDGTVEAVRLAGSTATMAAVPGATGKVHVISGEVRYQQVNLAELLRMLTGGGTGGAKRLLQRAVVDGIEVASDQATIRLKRVELSDVDGRAPEQPPPPVQPGAVVLTPEQQKLAAAYATDLIQFARIGQYTLEGMSVSVPQHGTFSIGTITIGGFSGRGIDRIEMTGFDFPVPGSPVRFDRFAIEGVTYGPFVDAALKAAATDAAPDLSPGQIAQLMPRISAVQLRRFDAETPQGPLAVGELRFALKERDDAADSDAAIDGLTIDLARLDANEGRDQLVALGYDRIVASARARVSWRRKERAVVVRTIGLALDQVGRIEIAARLDNVDFDKALADPVAAEDVLAEARLGPIEIRIENLGLAERFYTAMAKDAGLSTEAVRAGLAAEIRTQAVNGFGPLLADGAADALASFLQSPGTITARIAPATGKPAPTVAEIESLAPPELMDRFMVTLTAAPR